MYSFYDDGEDKTNGGRRGLLRDDERFTTVLGARRGVLRSHQAQGVASKVEGYSPPSFPATTEPTRIQPSDKPFPEALRDLLRLLGLTQAQLAQNLDWSPSYLSHVAREAHGARRTPRRIAAIANAAGATPNYFVEYRELQIDPVEHPEIQDMPIGRINQFTRVVTDDDRLKAIIGARRGSPHSGERDPLVTSKAHEDPSSETKRGRRVARTAAPVLAEKVDRDQVDHILAALESERLAFLRSVNLELASLHERVARGDLPDDCVQALGSLETWAKLLPAFPDLLSTDRGRTIRARRRRGLPDAN